MDVELDSNNAKYVLVALVILGGILGGVAAELMKTRQIGGVSEEGGWERPSAVSERYRDWGGWASVILGIVAAVIAMGLFDQIEDVQKTVPAKGKTPATTTTVEEYEVWRVAAITLIAGFSAPKFLALAQERLLAMLAQQEQQGKLISTNAAAQTHLAQARAVQASNANPETAAALAGQHAEVIEAMTSTALPGAGTGTGTGAGTGTPGSEQPPPQPPQQQG